MWIRGAIATLAAAAAVTACGENVNFDTGMPDAALGEASAGPEAGANARGPDATTAGDPDGGPGNWWGGDNPEGGCTLLVDGSPLCRPNGVSCFAAKDCCEGRCEQGYCLPSGACAAPDAPCTNRNNCCSARCEPAPRSGSLVCAQFCAADNQRCDQASDCCSLACHNGVCGGAMCDVAGSECLGNSDCCSGRCEGGRCALTFSACLSTGEGCGEDAGPGVPCCSGVCTGGRCDLGPGACREASAPCNVDQDCCLGHCLKNASGVSVCQAPCLADGVDCNSDGDCCGGLCIGQPSRCATPMLRCP
jgi:hypothetical protein